MMRCHWRGGALWGKCTVKLKEKWFIFKVTFWSLFYNSLTSWHTVLDAAMEPLVWIVDHFVRYLGPFFVVLVICLTTSVVVIFYVCLLPHKAAESVVWTCYHLIVGHWLLVNIVFHYFRAAFTDPGYPPHDVGEISSICKKCVAPKPPRTHHCSVCSKCILKMDHHCPWLNNCVGHFNHRYFFLFCVYMWLGTIYVSVSAYPLFRIHFYGNEAVSAEDEDSIEDHDDSPPDGAHPDKRDTDSMSLERDTSGLYYHQLIIYEFMLCTAVSLALTLLIAWHASMIFVAETSIEVHTNKNEAARQRKKGLVFKNPYNFGPRENWKIFLGYRDFRTFVTNVLLPSSHLPEGNGLKWRRTTDSPQIPERILLL